MLLVQSTLSKCYVDRNRSSPVDPDCPLDAVHDSLLLLCRGRLLLVCRGRAVRCELTAVILLHLDRVEVLLFRSETVRGGTGRPRLCSPSGAWSTLSVSLPSCSSRENSQSF